MELRALAEQILFNPSLEVKLACPDQLTDESPGSAILSDLMPARESALRFSQQRAASSFPALHTLESDKTRARVLHFFANHELLATELMALVILKFPDAPKAFRRGILRTLRDEQEHTRLYVRRLAELGVDFGEFPVNGYFWKMIAPMGIDAAIYRDPSGIMRLKPIIEINPRYTMGRLALELARHHAPGSAGLLQILSLPQLRQSNQPSFAAWASQLQASHPIRRDERERLVQGMVCLNDPVQATGCLAIWQASPDLSAFWQPSPHPQLKQLQRKVAAPH
jgi:hypothetical protein